MKWKEEEKARREGMSYALRIAKEKGIEELEKDLNMRKVVDLPIPVSKKALEECIDNIKNNTVVTAIDSTESKENIFTNIDGAVIV